MLVIALMALFIILVILAVLASQQESEDSGKHSPATTRAPSVHKQFRPAADNVFHRVTLSGNEKRPKSSSKLTTKNPHHKRTGRFRANAKPTPPAVDWVTGRKLKR